MTTRTDHDGTHRPAAGPARAGKPVSLKIFVVENHEDTRLSLTMLLEQLGHRVVSAATMAEALAALPAAGCDVLLSDIGLPDGDGWELLRRAGPGRPPYAVAMSGYGMAADREKSRAAGYRHHLVKPMALEPIEDLLAEAAEVLASERAGVRASAPAGS
jgi:CheY-like chemotaxis protein